MKAVNVLIAVALVINARAAAAQQVAVVTFRHYPSCRNSVPISPTCAASETVRLEAGGTLQIWIKNTKLDYFTAEVRAYSVNKSESTVRQVAIAGSRVKEPPTDSVLLELTHNARYSGYIVTISMRAPLPTDDGKPDGVQMPGPAVFIVSVNSEEERYAFSGGISLSSIRSAGFVATSETGSAPYVVESEKGRRDDASVGFATFVTVQPFSGKGKWYWPGIGIGLEQGAAVQYYFSPFGFRMSKGIYLNAGAVLGHVDKLPAGVRVTDSITDPNRLSDLPQRSKFGVFVGLSFTFLGGGKETFGRPFAGAAPP